MGIHLSKTGAPVRSNRRQFPPTFDKEALANMTKCLLQFRAAFPRDCRLDS